LNGLLDHNHNAVLFFSSLLLSLWLTPLAIRLAFRVNAVDRPDGRKVHTKAISRMGGASMVAGLFLPLLLLRDVDRTLAGFLLGAGVAALTGFLDDVYRISPRLKFAGEIAAAALFIGVSGHRLEGFGDFLGTGPVRLGALAPFVTIFCMVGVMNALNLSDGLDGLAGGIAAIACGFLGIFAYLAQAWTAFAILVALTGAILGFLRYNSHPANLFMGDTGSLLLGFSLAAVTVLLVRSELPGTALAPATVAAVMGLPILDTLRVMGRRALRRGNPFQADKTHLHHRLLALGLPHAAAVPILYMSTALFGFQAWHLMHRPEWVQFGAVLALGAGIYGTLALVERFGIRWAGILASCGERRRGEACSVIASVMRRSIGPAGWAIAVGLFLPIAALDAVPMALSLGALATGLFVGALFPWRSQRSHSGVCYGLIYACAVFLLGILQGTDAMPSWMPAYLAVLSALVLCWVLLKMRFGRHGGIVLFSSFEILLIGTSLFVALVVVTALGLGDGVRRLLLAVCLESVVFLLAMKLLVLHQPRRSPLIAGGLLLALAVIVLKGFLADPLSPVAVHGNRPPASAPSVLPTSREDAPREARTEGVPASPGKPWGDPDAAPAKGPAPRLSSSDDDAPFPPSPRPLLRKISATRPAHSR
jgi:UDP-GlcNAc:undecaprenyl-phosphate/decaprenyl-phosphate GlcNAc-1-phosphate transferase